MPRLENSTHVFIISGGEEPAARKRSQLAASIITKSLEGRFRITAFSIADEQLHSSGEHVELSDLPERQAFVFNLLEGSTGRWLYELLSRRGLPQYGNFHTDFTSSNALSRRDHLHNLDISTVPHWRFRHDFDTSDDVMYDAILRSVRYPVVVSPLPDNFSVDALVVENETELVEVLETCFSLDAPVSVTDTYSGNLYRVLLMPNFRGQHVYAFPPHELLHEHEVANTYMNEDDITSEPTANKAAENLAKAAFKKLQLRSLAAVDILETEEGEQYVLDVEAHPEISHHSQLQRSAHDVGASLQDIFRVSFLRRR